MFFGLIMVFVRRLDVHHRLAAGRHHQDTQGDRRRGQHRGPRAPEQQVVWREDLQRTRTAHRILAPVLQRARLRWLSEAVFRRARRQVVDDAAGAVWLSVRREDRRGW